MNSIVYVNKTVYIWQKLAKAPMLESSGVNDTGDYSWILHAPVIHSMVITIYGIIISSYIMEVLI